jgi:hypothetical protein
VMSFVNYVISVLQFGISSHDINEEFIIKHQLGCNVDHLATVHVIKPQDTIVVLGGFKMLYPIFDKSMRSNLSLVQKADIWKHLFMILKTLMNVEPSHVNRLFKGKYLLQTLRSCIMRWGLTQQYITKDLLDEVLKIAKDSSANKTGESILNFQKRFVFDILLNESICELTFVDYTRNRKGLLFEEVSETIY